jgi:hypothetical protein
LANAVQSIDKNAVDAAARVIVPDLTSKYGAKKIDAALAQIVIEIMKESGANLAIDRAVIYGTTGDFDVTNTATQRLDPSLSSVKLDLADRPPVPQLQRMVRGAPTPGARTTRNVIRSSAKLRSASIGETGLGLRRAVGVRSEPIRSFLDKFSAVRRSHHRAGFMQTRLAAAVRVCYGVESPRAGERGIATRIRVNILLVLQRGFSCIFLRPQACAPFSNRPHPSTGPLSRLPDCCWRRR